MLTTFSGTVGGQLRQVSLYILTYDARKLKHKIMYIHCMDNYFEAFHPVHSWNKNK